VRVLSLTGQYRAKSVGDVGVVVETEDRVGFRK
jgi:hypothetical protein